MFCPFCGKEIINNSKFCSSCGKNIPDAINRTTQKFVQQQGSKDARRASDITSNPKTSRKKTIFITITICVVVVCIGLAVVWLSGAFDGLVDRNQRASNVTSKDDDDDVTTTTEKITESTTKTMTETATKVTTTASPTEPFEIEIGGQTVWSDVERLSLGNCGISDITPLQSLTSLSVLFLSGNQISDITPLRSLTNLTELYISYNQISDITPLRSLVNLTVLDIAENQISDITPLRSLTDLTLLDIGENQISEISMLRSLANLTALGIYSNQISDITPLRSLTNLTILVIYNNKINDITPLKSLINLERLDLDNNPLSQTQINDLHRALPKWDWDNSGQVGATTATVTTAAYPGAAATTAAYPATTTAATATTTAATTEAAATTTAATTAAVATTAVNTTAATNYATIIYESDIANPKLADMSKAESLIRKRLDAQDVSDYIIERQGVNQMVVRIPSNLDIDIDFLTYYLIRTSKLTFEDEDGGILLSGSDVEDATLIIIDSAYCVSITFTEQGTRLFADATQRNLNKHIYINLNNELITAPTVQNIITNGEVIITGDFTRETADNLTTMILSASLPFDMFVASVY